jgi:hypothetical protein
MKIFFEPAWPKVVKYRHPKLEDTIEDSFEDNKSEQVDQQEGNGRPLSILMCLGLIICCSTWSLACWMAAAAQNVAQIQINSTFSNQCYQIPDDLRYIFKIERTHISGF